MDLQLSDKGLEFIKICEGYKNQCYPDSRQKPTIGIGHLIDLKKERYLLKKVLTDQEIKLLFAMDQAPINKFLNNLNWGDPIKQHEFDALSSFLHQYTGVIYGIGAYKGTYRAILSGDRKKIAEFMSLFKNETAGSGDNKMIPRRNKEIKLFLEGKYQ
jgi:GH24 family phage-related lysozyme (muramidase)